MKTQSGFWGFNKCALTYDYVNTHSEYASENRTYARVMNQKQYELKDHLGNVRVTFSDRKEPNACGDLSEGWSATATSVNNYYSFGMLQPGRNWNAGNYRFGFNGKENDNEVKGTGNSVDFGARMYDSRLGRWLSLDPLQEKYPGMSPYNFGGNSPIFCVDPDGKVIRVYYSETEYFDYTPGMKPPTDNEVQKAVFDKVDAAISYNMNTEVGKNVWSTLSSAEQVIEIRASGDDENRYDASSFNEKTADNKISLGTIFWDYDSPLEVMTNPIIEPDPFIVSYVKGYFSPSSNLFHEGGHGYDALMALLTNDPKKIAEFKSSCMENNGFGGDEQYGSKEEKNNIENNEQPYIMQINAWAQENSNNPQYQPVRLNHDGNQLDGRKVGVNQVYKPEIYQQWRKERIESGNEVSDGVKKN